MLFLKRMLVKRYFNLWDNSVILGLIGEICLQDLHKQIEGGTFFLQMAKFGAEPRQASQFNYYKRPDFVYKYILLDF